MSVSARLMSTPTITPRVEKRLLSVITGIASSDSAQAP